MSTLQMAYVGLVVVSMATLMVLLAWGMWYTRARRSDYKPAQTSEAAVHGRTGAGLAA